jgi:putative ABC transport system permease protein
MPDWTRLVRERLALRPLAGGREDSVVEEIAAQLEDAWRDALARGSSEEAARAEALNLIEDWDRLASEISVTVGPDFIERADRRMETVEHRLRRRPDRLRILAEVLHDLRLAARRLARRPSFTLLAVASLAVGLGTATSIFSVANAVFLRPLPITEPERVVEVYRGRGGNHAYPDYLRLQEACAPFLELAACDEYWYGEGASKPVFLRSGPDLLPVNLGLVSGEYFDVIGIGPALGRLLVPGDNRPEGGSPVAVLSWAFWQRRFAGRPEVVGSEIDLSGTSYRVVGIARRGFLGSSRMSSVDVWIPAVMRRAVDAPDVGYDIVTSDNSWIEIIGRLGPGISLDLARERLQAVLQDAGAFTDQLVRQGISIEPIQDAAVKFGVRARAYSYLRLLLLAAGLLVVVVGVNVMSLFLSRMDEEASAFAVRRALGARGPHLARDVLTESLLIALVGGGLALLLAFWMDGLLVGLLATGLQLSTVMLDLTLDLRVLAFATFLALVIGLAIGIPALLRLPRQAVMSGLRQGPSTGAPRRWGPRLPSILVVAQLALTMVLLTGAGLLLRTVANLRADDPGFDPRMILMLTLDNEHLSLEIDQAGLEYARLADRVRAIPGVLGVGIAKVSPLAGQTWSGRMTFEGYEEGPDEWAGSYYNLVDPGFLGMMGIRLVRGRGILPEDRLGEEKVAVVNEALARRFWPDSDPLGKTIDPDPGENRGAFRVVGVVADHLYSDTRTGRVPIVYFPIAQYFRRSPTLLVRTATDPHAFLGAVRAAVRELDPRINLHSPITLEEQIAAAGSHERASALLFLLFAAAALLLAAIGTYGVVDRMTRRHRREIGIRVALGARAEEILRQVVGRGLRLVAAGLVIGLVLAVAGTRLLGSLLFQVGAFDPLTYTGVTVILVAAGILACLLPARRALRVDPIEVLRAE